MTVKEMKELKVGDPVEIVASAMRGKVDQIGHKGLWVKVGNESPFFRWADARKIKRLEAEK